MTIKEAWNYIYGKGSHMNWAGKILLGVPMFPFVASFVVTWMLLNYFFTKKTSKG